MELSDHRTRDKQKINSKVFSDCYLINDYKQDAVRIGIANTLELIFRLFLCSMITEFHL